MTLKVLGIHYGGHDTSACITVDGKLIAACEQERYDKIKHSRSFPIDAIKDCLKISKLKINDIDILAYGSDPNLMLKERYLKLPIIFPKRIKFFSLDKQKIIILLNLENILRSKLNFKNKIEFNNHHLCHLYSAYFPSGFKNSLVVSYDGIGEIDTAMLSYFKNGKFHKINSNNKFPNSLGLIYSAVTYYLGWKHHCDEGIVMGLAPLGKAYENVRNKKKSYIEIFRNIIKSGKGLNYSINTDWTTYHYQRDTWLSKKFFDYFGKKRNPGKKIYQHHKNMAAALQLRIEEIVLSNLRFLKKKYKFNHLCIAGGVGLNCSLNGKIHDSKLFKKIFVQPASGDAGLSYGTAIVSFIKNTNKNTDFKNRNFYLGSRFTLSEIKKILLKYRNKIHFTLEKDIARKAAEVISSNNILGWFQGAAEFGPRALGNRSIICKPYPYDMKNYVNKNVKFRESFRPFAPAILESFAKEYFHLKQESQHMLIATKVKKNKKNLFRQQYMLMTLVEHKP